MFQPLLLAFGLGWSACQAASVPPLLSYSNLIPSPGGEDLRLIRHWEGAGGSHEIQRSHTPERSKMQHQLVTQLNQFGGMTGYHLPRGATFHPTNGQWRSSDFYLQARLATSPVGRRATLAPAIEQAGRIFVASSQSMSAGVNRAYFFADLTTSDFCEVTAQGRDPNAHPDFSNKGEPIVLGFALRHPALASGSTELVTIDYLGWSQRVTPRWTPDFSDGEFREDDWALSSSPSLPGGRSYGGRGSNAGDSGAGMVWTNALPVLTERPRLCHLQRYRRASFDPAQEGAVGSVDVALDGKTAELEFGGSVKVRVLVSQRGADFVAEPAFLLNQVSRWVTIQWSDRHANDFGLLGDGIVDPSVHPDFSTNGAPLQFGLALEVAGRSLGQLDNWSVHLRRVPGR